MLGKVRPFQSYGRLLVIIINTSDQISKAFKIMWRHFVKEVSKDPFFNVVFPIKEGI